MGRAGGATCEVVGGRTRHCAPCSSGAGYAHGYYVTAFTRTRGGGDNSLAGFVFSTLITLVMVGVILVVARKRPPGTPLTWAEAFIAAFYLFAVFTMAYGIVPHQWLNWSDSELGWRPSKIGIPLGPLENLGLKNPLWADGIPILSNDRRIDVNAQTIRDIVAAGIYVVALGVNIGLWLWWQKRKPAGEKGESTGKRSFFGRPIVKGA